MRLTCAQHVPRKAGETRTKGYLPRETPSFDLAVPLPRGGSPWPRLEPKTIRIGTLRGQPHFVDLDGVRRLCFEIHNLFAGNEALAKSFETAGDEDPDDLTDPTDSPLLQLHHVLRDNADQLGELRMVVQVISRHGVPAKG